MMPLSVNSRADPEADLNQDSILEIDEAGAPVALLASRRRHAPTDPVDERRNLGVGALIPAGDGTVRRFRNRMLYEEAADGWRELREFPEVHRIEVHADVTVFRNGRHRKSASVLPHGSLEPVVLYDLVDHWKMRAMSLPHLMRRNLELQAAPVRSNLSELLGENPLIQPIGDRVYYFQQYLARGNRYPHDPERYASLVIGSVRGGEFRVVPLVFEGFPLSAHAAGHAVGPIGQRISEHGFDLLVSANWLVLLHVDRGWILPKSSIGN